jgi:hypothetical protein
MAMGNCYFTFLAVALLFFVFPTSLNSKVYLSLSVVNILMRIALFSAWFFWVYLFKYVLTIVYPSNGRRIGLSLIEIYLYGIIAGNSGFKHLCAGKSFKLEGSCSKIGTITFCFVTTS